MDLKILLDTPPWDWPRDAGKMFRKILIDRRAKASDRLIAAELAGDFTVINDDLAGALLAIVRDAGEPGPLRARAAISFGPALEQAFIGEFEDQDDVPITEGMYRNIQDSLQKLYFDPSKCGGEFWKHPRAPRRPGTRTRSRRRIPAETRSGC